jgi:hypothetical protein
MDLRPLRNTTLLVVAGVYGLLLAMAEFAGLLGIPLLFMICLSIWRYGYEVLRRFAQGRFDDVPAPSLETMSPFGTGLMLHFVFFAVMAVFLFTTPLWADSIGFQLLRWSLLAALIGVFPASAALMSMGKDVGAALSPGNIASCIRTLGDRYPNLLAVCTALIAISLLVQQVVLPVLGWLAYVLSAMVVVWTDLALFALIGAAVHARREDFAIPGEYEPEEEIETQRLHKEWQQQMDLAYASFRSNLAVEGHATIKKLLDAQGRSLEIYQWVFSELWGWQDKSTALLFADGYIERLLGAGLQHEALDLFASCRRKSAQFAIAEQSSRQLASYARSIGRHGIADELQQPVAG